MWSNWKGTPQNWLILIGIILGIIILVSMLGRIFPWWVWIFFIFPMFGGWIGKFSGRAGGSHPASSAEKPKRYDASRVPEGVEMEDDRSTREEPRYALGDDGELIELPADERLSEPRDIGIDEASSDASSDVEADADYGDHDIEDTPRRQRRDDSDSHYDYV